MKKERKVRYYSGIDRDSKECNEKREECSVFKRMSVGCGWKEEEEDDSLLTKTKNQALWDT